MKYIITISVILLISVGGFGLWQGWFTVDTTVDREQNTILPDDGQNETDNENNADSADDSEQNNTGNEPVSAIGSSVNGNTITAHQYGNGDTDLLIVGGIHGGYSANTTLVARELLKEVKSDPSIIPDTVTLHIIPLLNPDGLNSTVGSSDSFDVNDIPSNQNDRISGRFNANNVDLNRNFDCNWQSTGVWQNRDVSGGDSPFSEPESQALRDYVNMHSIDTAIIYYSASGGVYTSSCNGTASTETTTLMNTYASASNYSPEGVFDVYELTGDAADWLSKQGITTISVLLATHTDLEWDQNKAGIKAVLESLRN